MKTINSPKVLNPSYDEISSRARDLWLSHGSPEGRDEEFWLSAERELRNQPVNKSNGLSTPRGEADRLGAKTREMLDEIDDGMGTRSATALNLT
jgi:hypothetical protein